MKTFDIFNDITTRRNCFLSNARAPSEKRYITMTRTSLFLIACILSLPLAGCEQAKNQLKQDRSLDMEFQDYRDALAPRMADVEEVDPMDGVPDFEEYMDSRHSSEPMPLVSVSVNQSVPIRDVLFELAEQAGYDIELDPNIRGSIIFTARNKPFDVVVRRISDIAGLRYKFEDGSLRIEQDSAYLKTYKIDYLSFVRESTGQIGNNISVVSGDGADTGSNFTASTQNTSDFWGELETAMTQILGVPATRGGLRTSRDPRITATPETPPVEQAAVAGEGSENVTPPQNTEPVLRVESLPLTDEEDPNSASGGSQEGSGMTFSLNRQAGIISVYAPERQQKEIAKYLITLKRAVTSQVLIEAKVLEVGLTDEFASGIDWRALNLLGGEAGIGFLGVNDGVVVPSLTPAVDPASNFAISYLGNDFQAFIQAISRFGTVHALASPRLTVLNNQPAVLNVANNRVYFEVDVDVTPPTLDTPQTITVDSEVRSVPEGVLINVQPSIDLDTQTISLSVRPTVTRIVDFINDPATAFVVAFNDLDTSLASAVPVLNVQEIDSVVKLSSGQTVVLGGLMQDRTTATQNATPILGEIPLIGAAFRNSRDSIQKNELVILLRATIVNGSNVHGTDKDLYRGFAADRRPADL